jgi:hypothetical protein
VLGQGIQATNLSGSELTRSTVHRCGEGAWAVVLSPGCTPGGMLWVVLRLLGQQRLMVAPTIMGAQNGPSRFKQAVLCGYIHSGLVPSLCPACRLWSSKHCSLSPAAEEQQTLLSKPAAGRSEQCLQLRRGFPGRAQCMPGALCTKSLQAWCWQCQPTTAGRLARSVHCATEISVLHQVHIVGI